MGEGAAGSGGTGSGLAPHTPDGHLASSHSALPRSSCLAERAMSPEAQAT